MATFTLGQMLEIALGSSRAGAVDFEQLHNLLNALLLHLGLRDLLVQENGEPLEGAEESPFAFLKELKERVEANEKEIAEVRALCQELREEVNLVKLEQSQMAEDMQYMLQNFNMEQFQNMMDELRNQLWESFMSAMKEMLAGPSSSRDKKSGQLLESEEDLGGLIVIGTEIPLVERPKTPKPGESRPASPSGKEKDEAASSDIGDSDMGQSDAAQSRARGAMAQRGVGQKDMRRNVQWGDTGQTDAEQKDVGVGRGARWSGRGQMDVGQDEMGQKDMGVGRGARWSSRGQMDVGQDEMGQDEMGQKDMRRGVQRSDAGQRDVGQKSVGKSVRWSDRGGADMGQDDMGQEDMERIKKEELETDISEVEALPSSLDSPPEMTSMEEITEEETKMGISKAPPHAQTKRSDGITSETHPGAPGSHVPAQRVPSVRGHPGSQDLWVPAESVAGPSSRLPTPKEARGEGGVRMEPYPPQAGLTFLRVPSAEYAPCDPLVKMSAQRPGFLPSTPPASPGLSMRLPRIRRPEQRDEAAEGYSRRSPMYSGGKHTSVSPVQRMEPLLPDPNLPGTYELMGKDGVVYRGRIVPE